MASMPVDVSVSRPYAVIDVGGQKQYVEEGSSFACPKQVVEEVSLGGTVTFPKVLAFKHNGELHKGRPYLDGFLVEGRLEDEFKGPNSSSFSLASWGSQDDQSQLMLRRILITSIRQA